jgi:hypothetical protein
MNKGNEQKLAQLRVLRDAALLSAEKAAYVYFSECQTGPERTRAAVIHEGIYCTVLNAELFAERISEGAEEQILKCETGSTLPDQVAAGSKLRGLMHRIYAKAIPTTASGRSSRIRSQALREALATAEDSAPAAERAQS